MEQNDISKIVNNTIQSSQNCIFSYLSIGGIPTGKALSMPRKIDPNGIFWFSTVNHSEKVDGCRQYPKASLYFYDPGQFIGVSLSGSVEVIDNPEQKRVFWQDGDEMFYPNGIDGDDYVILKFTTQTGKLYAQIQHFYFTADILD